MKEAIAPPMSVVATRTSVTYTYSPSLQRCTDPPPDGGYPGNNTAEGEDALFSLTTGTDNTAIGFPALLSNTTGSFNRATGVNALYLNNTGSFNTVTVIKRSKATPAAPIIPPTAWMRSRPAMAKRLDLFLGLHAD